ncbi:hypothetical protein DRP05_08600 [Archaeoglobales archaeon]|nr:MAG: hypothetical protein DRP05_08600 [Archaeoglobales archaeon]
MVKVIPFEENWSYPQSQRVKIENVAYDFFFRWNHEGNFCVLTVTRVEDSSIVFNGKLVKLNPVAVKDSTTYEELFVLLPWQINESKAEVWVFYD